MKPSYDNYQLVMIDKRQITLKQGDVIAFVCDGLDSVLVKRIIACPGDSVQIDDGKVYVNGNIYDSKNFNVDNVSYAGIAENIIVLAKDEYFVMGDNVEYSKDSRYLEVGCIKEKDILGRVIP